eukprot:GHVU01083204.1.p2 GENE.GHVU01083204.1~~GHVU01083204.1.p2  ORF type:complete len:177 (+),score=15.20 GHVU01083204.1:3415-3945(+)
MVFERLLWPKRLTAAELEVTLKLLDGTSPDPDTITYGIKRVGPRDCVLSALPSKKLIELAYDSVPSNNDLQMKLGSSVNDAKRWWSVFVATDTVRDWKGDEVAIAFKAVDDLKDWPDITATNQNVIAVDVSGTFIEWQFLRLSGVVDGACLHLSQLFFRVLLTYGGDTDFDGRHVP